MSQRGSFVTEYIHCEECFNAAKLVLLKREKHLCSTTIPTWDHSGGELRIIAGKLGHEWSEKFALEHEIAPELEHLLCHPLRVAVLEEGAEEAKTVVIEPNQVDLHQIKGSEK